MVLEAIRLDETIKGEYVDRKEKSEEKRSGFSNGKRSGYEEVDELRRMWEGY